MHREITKVFPSGGNVGTTAKSLRTFALLFTTARNLQHRLHRRLPPLLCIHLPYDAGNAIAAFGRTSRLLQPGFHIQIQPLRYCATTAHYHINLQSRDFPPPCLPPATTALATALPSRSPLSPFSVAIRSDSRRLSDATGRGCCRCRSQ